MRMTKQLIVNQGLSNSRHGKHPKGQAGVVKKLSEKYKNKDE
jgi:hypothetical protein